MNGGKKIKQYERWKEIILIIKWLIEISSAMPFSFLICKYLDFFRTGGCGTCAFFNNSYNVHLRVSPRRIIIRLITTRIHYIFIRAKPVLNVAINDRRRAVCRFAILFFRAIGMWRKPREISRLWRMKTVCAAISVPLSCEWRSSSGSGGAGGGGLEIFQDFSRYSVTFRLE